MYVLRELRCRSDTWKLKADVFNSLYRLVLSRLDPQRCSKQPGLEVQFVRSLRRDIKYISLQAGALDARS